MTSLHLLVFTSWVFFFSKDKEQEEEEKEEEDKEEEEEKKDTKKMIKRKNIWYVENTVFGKKKRFLDRSPT